MTWFYAPCTGCGRQTPVQAVAGETTAAQCFGCGRSFTVTLKSEEGDDDDEG